MKEAINAIGHDGIKINELQKELGGNIPFEKLAPYVNVKDNKVILNDQGKGKLSGTGGTGKNNLLNYNYTKFLSIKNRKTRSSSSTQDNVISYKESWQKIKGLYNDSEVKKKEARFKTANHLLSYFHFKTHPKTGEVYVFKGGTYKPEGEKVIRRELRQFLGLQTTDYDLREVISIIKDCTMADEDEFEQEELMINVANKDLKVNDDGSLDVLDIDPERVVLSRIPWEYDEEADCPKIKEFLKDVLTEQWIPTVQEMVGLCLANKYLTRKAFMLYGDGSNGKDILLDLIEELLTKENVSHLTLHNLERNRFAASNLVGKLANISGDLSERELKTSTRFKRITGGSTIPVEAKGKDAYSYEPYSTMIFAANTTPTFKEDNYALFDRWIIITFPYTFTDDPDDGYKDKVPREELISKLTTEEEMKGFLKWAIEGLKRLKRNNNRLTNQQSSEEIREAWMERSDSITAFAKHKIEKDLDNKISKRKVYEIYRDWCTDNNYTPEPMQKVGKLLPTKSPASKGSARIDGKKTKVWKGIKINGEESDKEGGNTLNEVLDTQRNMNKSDILDIYPDSDEEPEEVISIKERAMERGMSSKNFEKTHKTLKEDGEIHEPRPGQFKRT